MRDKLRAYMEEKGLTVAGLARTLGVSRAYMSRYLNGEDIEKVKEAGEAFFRKLRSSDNGRWRFVETKNTRVIWGLCRSARDEGEIAVVIGRAGAGKTFALREYARRHPGTVYLKADVTFSSRELLTELGERLSVFAQGTTRAMLRQLERVLLDDPRLVIVDEADVLTVRQLEMLRALHDSTECGLILAGLPRLKLLLTRGPSARENLAQLFSRVGYIWECPYPDEEDVRQILEAQGVSYDESAIKEVMRIASSNGMRGVVKLTSRALKVIHAMGTDGNNGRLKARHIREARNFILTGG